VRADDAAGEHRALGAPTPDALDAEPDQAVVDQHLVARLQHLADHRRQHGQLAVARALVAGDDHFVATRQRHRIRKVADPEFRALQIGDQRKRAADRLLHVADEASALGVLFASAVGKIEPRGVHPGFDERAHSFGGAGRGSDRGDDLGSPRLVSHHVSVALGSSTLLPL
jgi:hypothetical protein